jgi:protein-S-isoprenylcysteine O-methyltransferase
MQQADIWDWNGVGTTVLVSGALGVGMGFGAAVTMLASENVDDQEEEPGPLYGLRGFGFYLCILSFFHISEYLCVAIFNPHLLSFDSFLINHSRNYTLAISGSILEFFLEYFWFPWLKGFWPIYLLGLAVALFGQGLRLAALLTAGSTFTHIIQQEKRTQHTLVRHGVYKYSRHPGYAGSFWWGIGIQLLLVNPLCCLWFAYLAHTYFSARIKYEEKKLVKFFKDEYVEYRKVTPTLIPFVP